MYEFKNNKTDKIITLGADNYLSACMKLLTYHNKVNTENCILHDIKRLYTSLQVLNNLKTINSQNLNKIKQF